VKAQLKLVGVGVLFVIIQSLIMNLTERRLYPDLVLILALTLGLRGDKAFPLMLAFGFGFAIDVLSSSSGLYALLRGTACAATHVADRALYLRAPAPWAMYVLGYVVLDSLLLGVVTQTLKPEVAPAWGDLLWPIPLVAVITSLVSAPLYPVLDRMESTAAFETTWGTLKPKGRG
jgi:rod shape-determining protein MreD